MEDYRKALRKFFTPSLFLFLVTAASVDLGFTHFTWGSSAFIDREYISQTISGPGLSAGIILITASILLLPFIYCNSIRSQSYPKKTGKKKLHNASNMKLMLLIILAFITTAGIMYKIEKRSREHFPLSVLDNSLFTISGEIIKLNETSYGSEIILNFIILNRKTEEKEKNPLLKGHLYLRKDEILKEGKKLTMKCGIKKIIPDRNVFSDRMDLLRRGIQYSLKPVTGTVKISGDHTRKKIFQIKELLAHRIDNLFPEKTSSLVKALILGERKHISWETRRIFREAGVLHILAASGLHVGIVASIPLFLLGAFRINRKTILIITFFLLILYLFITGIPVSLLRASIMFVLTSIIFITGLEKNMLNVLFLTASAVLVIAPEELYTMGFQLSFGATAGVIILYKIFREIFSFLPGFLETSASLTLSVQAFVLPLVAYHMGIINFTGIFSNILIIPAVSLIMILSVISGLISLIVSDFGIFLARVTHGIYTLVLKFIYIISYIKGHFSAGIEMTFPVLICMLSTLFIYPFIKNKKLLALPLLLCVAGTWYTLSPDNSFSRKKFTLFEKQGKKALLINSENNRFLMGEIHDIKTAQTIVRKIKEQGIDRINLIITNPDFYNTCSYNYIMRSVKVNQCVISSQFEFSEPVKHLFTQAEKKKIIIEFADIRTDTKLIEGNRVSIDETGYAGALAAFSKFISANDLKTIRKHSTREVQIVNLD